MESAVLLTVLSPPGQGIPRKVGYQELGSGLTSQATTCYVRVHGKQEVFKLRMFSIELLWAIYLDDILDEGGTKMTTTPTSATRVTTRVTTGSTRPALYAGFTQRARRRYRW